MKPLLDNLIIKPLPKEDKTKGGLIIPDSVKQPVGRAEVIEISIEQPDSPYQKGDTVIFREGSGTPIEIDGVEMLLINRPNIVCIV